jgi:hypothetical protein
MYIESDDDEEKKRENEFARLVFYWSDIEHEWIEFLLKLSWIKVTIETGEIYSKNPLSHNSTSWEI